MTGLNQTAINSSSPFGASKEWLGKYMVDYAFRDYAPRKVPHPFGPLNAEGIPLFDLQHVRLKGAPIYHPIVIIQYALAHYGLWLDGQSASQGIFLNGVRWLEENAVPDREHRFLVWKYPFAHRSLGIEAGWISGIAQGQALSLLVRAYQLTGETKTAEIIQQAAASFRYSLAEGGLMTHFPSGGQFVEEVASPPVLQILNGCLYALSGLDEYLKVFPDPTLQTVLEACIKGVEEKLPEFDTGWWSRYSLGFRWHLAPMSYHLTHIHQLRYLAQIFENAKFATYAEKWDAYYHSTPNKLRFRLIKSLQLNLNRALAVLHLDHIKYNISAKMVT